MKMSARPKRKRNPNLDECRTGRVGATIPGTGREMFYCLIDNDQCKYFRPFGFDNLCNHPNGEMLVTEDEDPVKEDAG